MPSLVLLKCHCTALIVAYHNLVVYSNHRPNYIVSSNRHHLIDSTYSLLWSTTTTTTTNTNTNTIIIYYVYVTRTVHTNSLPVSVFGAQLTTFTTSTGTLCSSSSTDRCCVSGCTLGFASRYEFGAAQILLVPVRFHWIPHVILIHDSVESYQYIWTDADNHLVPSKFVFERQHRQSMYTHKRKNHLTYATYSGVWPNLLLQEHDSITLHNKIHHHNLSYIL